MVFTPINISGSVIDSKALSPSANVHVDVVNHVAGVLASHAKEFHHTWRDYSVIFLLVIVLGASVLLCCGVLVVCLYHRLLIQLVHRSTNPPPTRSPPYTARSMGSLSALP